MSALLDRLHEALAPQYEVERELASGGMGTVFLARDPNLDRPVAIKILRPELGSDTASERFLREARILARLSHPNVVPVFQAGQAGGLSYYVMEYVEGATLKERLERGTMSKEEALKLADDVLSALEEAHKHGIVHRDVKPGNIFLVGDRALLGDFGIAKRTGESATGLTGPGRGVGTPDYMPPEQIAGAASPRTDLYAVGMVVYEALTGRKWSIADTTTEVDWSGIAPELLPVLRRALAWSPEERWQDALSFRNALARSQQGAGKRGLVAAGAASGVIPAMMRGPWRRALVGGVVAVVVMLGAGWWLLGGAGGERPGIETLGLPTGPVIAVFPFSVRGSDEFAYLREGMVDLLSTKLDGAGDLRTVDVRALLNRVAREGSDEVDPQVGRAISERFGAGRYVLGDIVEASGRLHINASLYDRNQGAEAVVRATAEGEATQIFRLVDELAARLLRGQIAGEGERMMRMALLTTRSFPALKAYLKGENDFRADRLHDAIEAFKRAVAADSSFALAYYRLAAAAAWVNRTDLLLDALEQSLRYKDRLSESNLQLAEAFFAFWRGEAAEAESRYRTIVGTNPDDVEAWYWLGEVLVHLNPFRGRSVTEARQAMERALNLEPKHAFAHVHLIEVVAREGRLAELDSLTARFLELYPEGDQRWTARALRAFEFGDEAAQEKLANELRLASDLAVWVATYALGAYASNLQDALSLAPLFTVPTRSPEVRVTGHLTSAQMELAQGRWSAAKAAFSAAQRVDPTSALEYRALVSVAPFLQVSEEELESLKNMLRDWDVASAPKIGEPNLFIAPLNGVHPVVRAYLLGLLSAHLGEHDTALQHAEEVENLEVPPLAGSLASDLAQSLRAHVASKQGNALDALAAFEQSPMKVIYPLMLASPFYSHSDDRFLRAELLKSLGRYEEALSWYRSVHEMALYDLIYLAPSHLGQGEIYEELGEQQKAIEHYTQFLELWHNCDPELQPKVDDVNGRLERLKKAMADDS